MFKKAKFARLILKIHQMKKVLIFAMSLVLFTSCVSKKKFLEIEQKNKECQDLLNSTTMKLNLCLKEKEGLNDQMTLLRDKNNLLDKSNKDLSDKVNNLTVLSAKGAQNVEKFLESLREKDVKINRLQDALTKKDSVTLALVTSLKREVGLNDPDIEVNVEKGVVFISLSDKMLFKSGSYDITIRASEILAKVAKVINDKPTFECLVEGHTDNVPYKNGQLLDNWDLSVKRSTAIVRELVGKHNVKASQLIAAGRSEFLPLVPNTTAENRSINRRTKIIIMPKIDEFYDMIEKEMKNLSKN
jgi:chemotaxis protein MotB